MPGKRKFRLAPKKNFERKKYLIKRELEMQSFTVSIPKSAVTILPVSISRNIYHTASAPNLMTLAHWVTNTADVFLPEWSVESNEAHLCMSNSSYQYGNLQIVIQNDFTWNVKLDDQITQPPHSQATISSVAQLQSFCQRICMLKLCEGNPDQKYDDIRKARTGKFMDITGMYVMHMHICNSNIIYVI